MKASFKLKFESDEMPQYETFDKLSFSMRIQEALSVSNKL
jgi:hypothetical protein